MGHRPMHAVVGCGFLLWGGIVMHQPAHAREAMAASPADHFAIVAAVNEIGLAADMRDWPRVRAQFADEVLVERVQLNAAGQVELKLKTAWRDGTTHLVMSPLEFMQRRIEWQLCGSQSCEC